MEKPENHLIIIFGASGDLTSRKLIPALNTLYRQNLLPEKFAILGIGRTSYNDDSFRELVKESLQKFADRDKVSEDFISRLHYFSMDYNKADDYRRLKEISDELRARFECGSNILFYLATPPKLYEVIPELLAGPVLIKKDIR